MLLCIDAQSISEANETLAKIAVNPNEWVPHEMERGPGGINRYWYKTVPSEPAQQSPPVASSQ